MSKLDDQNRQLLQDAIRIWQAGVAAVTPRRLFQDLVRIERGDLVVGDSQTSLAGVRRLVVIGAGKASAAMAAEFERTIAPQLSALPQSISLTGWINCPQGADLDAVNSLPQVQYPANESQVLQDLPQEHTTTPAGITLFPARPIGVNQPTTLAVHGTNRILDLVGQCDDDDLVVCMLSGGGSALLVAPVEGITLSDKQRVAQIVAAAGGDIHQLNSIRRCLSSVKGGGLARACRAKRMLVLVLSDVLGDPLDVIASGPTLRSATCQPTVALQALDQLGLSNHPLLSACMHYLRSAQAAFPAERGPIPTLDLGCEVEHVILGNNADAVDAAGVKAVELGYRYVMQAARTSEGDVSSVAAMAAQATKQIAKDQNVDCWISGGEPTVTLPDTSGLGGRNQHLVLSVLKTLVGAGWPESGEFPRPIVFLSGGSDGEDGPTDAAGAYLDADIWNTAQRQGLDIDSYLRRADSYHFFEPVGGLLQTGPTGTNVCDLRIALAELGTDHRSAR